MKMKILSWYSVGAITLTTIAVAYDLFVNIISPEDITYTLSSKESIEQGVLGLIILAPVLYYLWVKVIKK